MKREGVWGEEGFRVSRSPGLMAEATVVDISFRRFSHHLHRSHTPISNLLYVFHSIEDACRRIVVWGRDLAVDDVACGARYPRLRLRDAKHQI